MDTVLHGLQLGLFGCEVPERRIKAALHPLAAVFFVPVVLAIALWLASSAFMANLNRRQEAGSGAVRVTAPWWPIRWRVAPASAITAFDPALLN